MSVTERDYELISAYLDGELTESERADLETRLQNDPALQRELQTLRQTVALIRQLPERPAPRDFTLDSRAFGRPALPFPLTMTFSVLSAAAAALLFVFGGYFLLQAGMQPMASNAPQEQPLAQDLASTQAAAVAALPSVTMTAAPTQMIPSATMTALPTQAMLPATPTAPVLPTMETGLDSQLAQMTDTESDEAAAAASEPALGDTDTGSNDLFAANEGAQAPPSGEAQEESRTLAEAPATSGDSVTNGVVVGGGGGGMATAAAPALAMPAPTTVAAYKSSDTPETMMRAVPSTESNAAEIPADDTRADGMGVEREDTVGRTDDRARQQVAASVDSRGKIGVGLLAAGVLLLVAAILTTTVRQRRLHP